MNDEDKKVIVTIIALWIIQIGFAVGSPIREELEIRLVLSLVPPIDGIYEILKVFGEGDIGSFWFYVRLFTVWIKDALLAYLWERRRSKNKRKRAR